MVLHRALGEDEIVVGVHPAKRVALVSGRGGAPDLGPLIVQERDREIGRLAEVDAVLLGETRAGPNSPLIANKCGCPIF